MNIRLYNHLNLEETNFEIFYHIKNIINKIKYFCIFKNEKLS